MPATVFNALRGVIAHSMSPMDPATLDTLKAETYLLVHSAPVAAENDYMEKTDVNGDLVFAAWYNFKIRWSVEATALALAGLADYHPGAPLSTQNLEFLNAARWPFQMGDPDAGGSGSRLVYERPRQDPVAGDMVEVSFDIVSMFGSSDGPGSVAPAAPVLSSSFSPWFGSGADWGAIYGFTVVWLRRLKLISPYSGGIHYTAFPYWQKTPAGGSAPDDWADFRATLDTLPNTAGLNVIAEVFAADLPGGRYLYPEGATTGEILTLLQAGGGDPFPAPDWNFFFEAELTGGGGGGVIAGGAMAPGVTDAAGFISGGHVPAGHTLVALYSLAALDWLPVP